MPGQELDGNTFNQVPHALLNMDNFPGRTTDDVMGIYCCVSCKHSRSSASQRQREQVRLLRKFNVWYA